MGHPEYGLNAGPYSLGSNKANGLHRTNADKRYCIRMALENFPDVSSREIAKLVGVNHTTVDNARAEFEKIKQGFDVANSPPATRNEAAGGKFTTSKGCNEFRPAIRTIL